MVTEELAVSLPAAAPWHKWRVHASSSCMQPCPSAVWNRNRVMCRAACDWCCLKLPATGCRMKNMTKLGRGEEERWGSRLMRRDGACGEQEEKQEEGGKKGWKTKGLSSCATRLSPAAPSEQRPLGRGPSAAPPLFTCSFRSWRIVGRDSTSSDQVVCETPKPSGPSRRKKLLPSDPKDKKMEKTAAFQEELWNPADVFKLGES